jgi:GNAT superfamily N-acetyltransferase
MSVAVATVGEGELDELRPLLRAYCDFYAAAPADEALDELSRALIGDPDGEGLQLLAREGDRAVGFATVFWTWSTTRGSRIGVMNDLYVAPEARGAGAADALIEACAQRCRARGVPALVWVTAPDNRRAQAVYDRVGGRSSTWLRYELEVG